MLKREMPHWCMAIKGEISRMYAYIRFRIDDRWHNGWLWLATDDNEQFYYLSPNDGRDFGYHCFDMNAVLSRLGCEMLFETFSCP